MLFSSWTDRLMLFSSRSDRLEASYFLGYPFALILTSVNHSFVIFLPKYSLLHSIPSRSSLAEYIIVLEIPHLTSQSLERQSSYQYLIALPFDLPLPLFIFSRQLFLCIVRMFGSCSIVRFTTEYFQCGALRFLVCPSQLSVHLSLSSPSWPSICVTFV